MLILSFIRITGTSKKTGKNYDFIKIGGLDRDKVTNKLINTDVMVSPNEWENAQVEPGDIIRVFNDGGIFVVTRDAFDMSIFDGVV